MASSPTSPRQSMSAESSRNAETKKDVICLGDDTFHSLWYDTDDQIVCSGPSSGLPMLERLGALHFMTRTQSTSPSEDTLAAPYKAPTEGQQTASSPPPPPSLSSEGSEAYRQMVDACPPAWMNMLVRHHFSSTGIMWPILHKTSFVSVGATWLQPSPPQPPAPSGVTNKYLFSVI